MLKTQDFELFKKFCVFYSTHCILCQINSFHCILSRLRIKKRIDLTVKTVMRFLYISGYFFPVQVCVPIFLW